MIKLVRITLLALVSLVFVGCFGGSPKPNNSSSLPQWYLNTPSDSPFYYFGVGSGASKNEAVNAALNQIAGKISTSVESSIETKKKSSMSSGGGASFSKDVEESVKAKVQGMKFSNYRVKESSQNGGNIYLLVEVDREALFAARKKELDSIDSEIDEEWKRAKSLTAFEKLAISVVVAKKIEEARSSFPILSSIKEDFSDTSYDSKYTQYSTFFQNVKDNIYAYFKRGNALEFENVVKRELAQYGVKIINSPSKSKDSIVVKVTKEFQKLPFKVQGNDVVKVTVNISTYSSSNKLLAKNSVSVKNASKSGVKDASRKTIKFEKEISKQGIMTILTGS